MASASVSFTQKRFKYDVFLSFRGEDTCKNFVDHLYHALQSKGIKTYKDDRNITKGGRIDDQLVRSIEESKLFIIVLSKNYANSSWCLDELVKIMERRKMKERTHYSIFYDVEPTEVYHHSGAVKKAFAIHEKKEDAEKWRDVLKEAAMLGGCGWDLKTMFDGNEAKLIQEVVEDISVVLLDQHSVGVKRLKTIPLKETLEMLEQSYNDLVDDHKEIFLDVACLLNGEKKDQAIKVLESRGFYAAIGLRDLEEKSFITISNQGFLLLHDRIAEMGRSIVRSLYPNEPNRHSRLWIKEEIEEILINDLGTEATRCLKLLNTHLSPDIIMNGLIKMKELEFLYVDNGYKTDVYTSPSNYKCASLPNALRYLYWHNYSLSSLPKTFHAKKLVSLEMPHSNISQLWSGVTEVLYKLRFIDLTFSRLRTFDLGLTPCLESLKLGGCTDFFELHMPVQCSKLKYLNLSGSKLSSLDLRPTPDLVTLNLYMPVKCPNLQYLNLSGSKLSRLDLWEAPCLEELHLEECKELVELNMQGKYPNLRYSNLSGSKLSRLDLSRTSCLEELHLEECNELVELDMPVQCSKLKYLNLSGSKLSSLSFHLPFECPKLKYLNLSGSKLSNLDLWEAPCLEELHFEECNELVELNMQRSYPNLRYFNLSGSKLSNLDLRRASCLEELHLEECNELVELDMLVQCSKLKYLNLSGSKLRRLDLREAPCLEELNLKDCNNFVGLQMPFDIPKLKYLNYSGSKLSNLDLWEAPCLEELHLEECNELVELNMRGNYPNLRYFNLSGSKLSDHNLQLTSQLQKLESLEKLTLSIKDTTHLPDSICKLKHLKSLELKSCFLLEHLPKDIGRLECLEKLHLSDCISLRDVPNSICNIKGLKNLHLPYSALVEKLPDELGRLECLEELNIEGTGIKHLPQSIFQLKDLCIVWSRGRLESHGFTSLEKLSRYTASCYIKNKK